MSAPWGEVLAEIEERERAAHAEARASSAVSRSVSRRRATRVAAIATAVGCILGASGWEAAHPPPPPRAPEAKARTLSAPVSLDVVNDRSLSAFGALPACGSPAPTVRTSYGGIRIEPAIDADIYNKPDDELFGGALAQRVTTGPTAPTGTPVVAVMGAIYVKGGVVVGYATAGADPVFGTLGVDTLNPSVGVHVGSPFCVGSSVDFRHGLPVGTYLAYPVVRIHASPAVAAWRALLEGPNAARAGSPAPAPPGCQSIAGATSPSSLAPECIGTVGADVTGRTIAVQYPTGYYTGDLDLRLVGNPVTFTVDQTLDPRQTWAPTAPDGTPWPTVPRCGALYTDTPPTDATPVYLSLDPITPGALRDGAPVVLEVGVRASRTPASVAFNKPLDVWATAPRGDGAAVRRIVAHGQIVISPYVGAQLSTSHPWSLVSGPLTSFEWCPGVEPTTTVRMAVTGEVLLSNMSGTATVRTADVR